MTPCGRRPPTELLGGGACTGPRGHVDFAVAGGYEAPPAGPAAGSSARTTAPTRRPVPLVTARPSWRTRRHHSQDSGQTGAELWGAERTPRLGPGAPTPRPSARGEMAVPCPGTGVTRGRQKGAPALPPLCPWGLQAVPGAGESLVGTSSEATGQDFLQGSRCSGEVFHGALQFSCRTVLGRGGEPLSGQHCRRRRGWPWHFAGRSASRSALGCGQLGGPRERPHLSHCGADRQRPCGGGRFPRDPALVLAGACAVRHGVPRPQRPPGTSRTGRLHARLHLRPFALCR